MRFVRRQKSHKDSGHPSANRTGSTEPAGHHGAAMRCCGQAKKRLPHNGRLATQTFCGRLDSSEMRHDQACFSGLRLTVEIYLSVTLVLPVENG